MPLPAAKVKIDVLKIAGLPAVALNPGDTRYARLLVQVGSGPLHTVTGRTRPIPAAGADFDLSPEAVPWHVDTYVQLGDTITLTAWIWEDHGDDPPPAPTQIVAAVNDPWKDGTQDFGPGPTIQVKVTTERTKALGGGRAARAVNHLDDGPIAADNPLRFNLAVRRILCTAEPDPAILDVLTGLYEPESDAFKAELHKLAGDEDAYQQLRSRILARAPGLAWWIRMIDGGGAFVKSLRAK